MGNQAPRPVVANPNTPELAAKLLASPMSATEQAELADCEAAIKAAFIAEGEALSRLLYLKAHRNQRTQRGRAIPSMAAKWKAYLEQEHGLTVAEAKAAMIAYGQNLAQQLLAKRAAQ